MKSIILITFILICGCVAAQKDTTKKETPKKDTVRIIQREVRDTLKAGVLYVDPSGFVKFTQGFAIRVGLTEDGKRYIGTPKIVACLDDKRKELKTWFQIL